MSTMTLLSANAAKKRKVKQSITILKSLIVFQFEIGKARQSAANLFIRCIDWKLKKSEIVNEGFLGG